MDIRGPVVFFTGAGVSVGAGLPTYRGSGGLYANTTLEPPNAADVTPEKLAGLWARFAPRLTAAVELQPARAHEAIAEFEHAASDPVTVITQNVDGLHSAAGSTRVHELHGSLAGVRCLPLGHRARLAEVGWDGTGVPACPTCAADCRPDVVLFGEGLDSSTWSAAEAAVRSAATIVAAGTSAVVYPAVLLIDPQLSPGAERIWVNPEDSPPDADWTWLQGSADDMLPRLRPSA